MDEKIINNAIQKLTSSIFENAIDEVEVVKRLDEIHGYFQQITEITGSDFVIEHMAAIPTARGKALGLNFAAQCLLDYKRTTKFLKAIVAAIKEKQKAHPGELIKICYAGCGPYAPFVTLIAPLFQPEEIQFTVLEINKNSVKSAKKLIEGLKLSNYVNEIYTADAVTFQVPNSKSFHILISETLDAVLYRECYVPILFNLLPQFNRDITLIPENVILHLSFLDKVANSTNYKENEGKSILNVRESVATFSNSENIPSQLPEVKVDLTSLNTNCEKMIIDTKVHVYNDIWLSRNESSLTIPLEIVLEQPLDKKEIIFTYFIAPEIELKCSMV